MTGYCQHSISEIKQFARLSGPSLQGANKSYRWPETFRERVSHMVLLRSAEGWNETGPIGLNIPPRPAAVCSSHPGTPAHTLRCGLELSQKHSEERLDERDWVYSANHRPTVCLLPCLPAVSYSLLHTQLLVCEWCLCGCYMYGVEGGVAFITEGGTCWNKSCRVHLSIIYTMN